MRGSKRGIFRGEYEEVHGVRRYRATNLNLEETGYDYSASPECITIPRKTLERELQRIIEEAMIEGGAIVNLAACCMKALDADANVYANQ